jgi:hypothetical protein
MKDLTIAKKMISIKHSAGSRGISFDMTFRKVKQLMTRKTCYYTGVTFGGENIRSFDRVDNDKGYIDSNVVACTTHINSLKGHLTRKDIKNLNKRLERFLEKQKLVLQKQQI